MNRADDGWTVMNEMGIDGSCHGPEEEDGKALSQSGKVERCSCAQSASRMLGQAQEHPATSQDPEYTFTLMNHQSVTIAPSPLGIDQGRYCCYLDHHEDNTWLKLPQDGSTSPTIDLEETRPQPDISPYIPRTGKPISELLRIPGLSTSLNEGNRDEWVRECTKWRDRAYSNEAVNHFVPLAMKDSEETSSAQHTGRTSNKQHTQGVEHRQHNYSHNDTDDVEDEPNTK